MISIWKYWLHSSNHSSNLNQLKLSMMLWCLALRTLTLTITHDTLNTLLTGNPITVTSLCYMAQCQQWSLCPICHNVTSALKAKFPSITQLVASDCLKETMALLAVYVIGPKMINPSPPGQNGCHFAYHIFKCIFFNENVQILIKISLKFVPKGPNP